MKILSFYPQHFWSYDESIKNDLPNEILVSSILAHLRVLHNFFEFFLM